MRKGLVFLATVLMMAAASPIATAAAASDAPQQHNNIYIEKNDDFDPGHGIRKGSGTAADPYVISGWDVDFLMIRNTSKHVIIRDNKIETLVLDWIGGGAHVYDNEVGDLRVNQNVKRTGDMTSGVIRNNTFEVVGQLRHWDGIFEHNTVGSPTSCMDVPFIMCRAVNFDGFNGAKFRHNNIYGYVEVRLHGHHHSSGFGAHSHYHGSEEADMIDHSNRHHRVWVTDNTIRSGDYYGLVYTDSNHAGNDRTAASEENEELNKPHIHKTKVFLQDNKIFGSGIEIDIFNAQDERHTGTKTGLMQIKGNEIRVQTDKPNADDVFSSKNGIYVRQARDLNLRILANKIDGSYGEADVTAAVRKDWDNGSGIYLWDIDKASVKIANNAVKDRVYGIRASSMSETVRWTVTGLKTTGVEDDIYYDNSVKNEPRVKE